MRWWYRTPPLLTGADGATTVMVIAADQHAHQQSGEAGDSSG